jgi:ubiquinone/menaquinone biosynthesis C-methylase UbiE
MAEEHPKKTLVRKAMLEYYGRGDEAGRLFTGVGQLERVRTQAILKRYLPPPPAVIYDVGGGPGVYAAWLAQVGYEVHLVDPVPLHLDQARQASQEQLDNPIASFTVGEAQRLGAPGRCADAVLQLGPLYHLLERRDRIQAIREAGRVLRPGGVYLGAGISRYASTLVGLVRGFVDDPEFMQMLEVELSDGRHELPPSWPALFTESYFHHPDELKTELEAGGLIYEVTLAVEGFGWLLKDFEAQWGDPILREGVLTVVRWLEADPVALGVSPHLLVVGFKKGAGD